MIKPDLSKAGTVGEAWLIVRKAFRAANLETADLDARVLTASLSGLEPHQLVTARDTALTADQRNRLSDAARDRLNHKPVHRILGAREFYGLALKLSDATLEPRPDTETLIDAALPFVHSTIARKGTCSIVDLGIGTGAIGLALIAECPAATCLGVDVSEDAVATATENARTHGLSERYRAVVSDWFSNVEGQFDLVVSNPPYIPTEDLLSLAPEVTDHDPMLALDGGPDGLVAYRAIAGQAAKRLEPEGQVMLEMGIGQGASVTALFAAAGFEPIGVFADLGGVDRVLSFGLSHRSAMTGNDF